MTGRATKVNGSSAMSAGSADAGLELVAGTLAAASAVALQAWPGGQLCVRVFGCV